MTFTYAKLNVKEVKPRTPSLETFFSSWHPAEVVKSGSSTTAPWSCKLAKYSDFTGKKPRLGELSELAQDHRGSN